MLYAKEAMLASTNYSTGLKLESQLSLESLEQTIYTYKYTHYFFPCGVQNCIARMSPCVSPGWLRLVQRASLRWK